MDNAVAMVQTYLRMNGYFTVAEFPVIEATRTGYRAATDLDILAVRFPHAGHLVPRHGNSGGGDRDEYVADPVLGASATGPDMIIGEVKEGLATLNAGATDPTVLRAVFVRFGCCAASESARIVDGLLSTGSAMLPNGHHVRLVAFGGSVPEDHLAQFHAVSLSHVALSLQAHIRANWGVLRHSDHKDAVFGFLVLLEKVLGRPPHRG
jgi:hypothetical protein